MASQLHVLLTQALDANAKPISGAKWKFYVAGTTTPQAVYEDADLENSLGAVVTADSAGVFPPMFYDSSKSYRGVLCDAAGTPLPDRDFDPINVNISEELQDIRDAIDGKVDHYPENPYSTVSASYQSTLNAVKSKWWNGTNIVPTIGDGQALNGLANPDTSADPSMWQMWTLFSGLIYEPWKLAVANGDTGAAASLVAMATSQWAYILTKYTATELKQSTGGVANTSDDSRLHLMGMCWVHEMTGAATALSYAEECLWYTLTRFHDPLQTATDYAVSTPDGTAAKSDPYGVLYGASTDKASIETYGYISSSNEFGFGLAALYLYTQNVATKTACLTYAQSLATHTGYLTPAPVDASKSAQYLVYVGFNLDPNVAAPNATASAGSISGTTFTSGGTVTGTFAIGQYLRGAGVSPGTKITAGSGTTWTVDTSQTVAATSINGTLARSGHGDSNQTWQQGQNAHYGKPLRGTSSVYLGGTCMFAALNAWLYAITGTAGYLTMTQNVTNAIASTQGFGRIFNGVPYLIQARDPWSDGDNLAEVVRRCIPLAGVDTSGTLKLAIVNTAKAVMAGITDGYLSPDWLREKGVGTTETWLEDGAAGYGGNFGGGQAKPTQIMSNGSTLGLVVAAARLVPLVQTLGSGATSPVSIETLAAELAALKAAIDNRLPLKGGTLAGRLAFRVLTFFADLNSAGWPFLNWASNVIDQYNPSNGRREFYNGTTASPEMTIDANGLGVRVKGPLRFDTAVSENTYVYDNSTDVLFNVAADAYLVYRKSTKKWGLTSNGVLQIAWDTSGNSVQRGAATTGTPTLS